MSLRRALAALLPGVLATATVAAQDITVYGNGSVAVGATRQLTAYVPLSPNTVNWSVNGVPGGNATYGTITGAGLYAAPTGVPAANAVAVRATSTAYPARFGEATITVTQVPVRLWGSSPATVPAGAFTLRLNGAAFNEGAVALFGGAALATTRVSASELRARGSATAAQVGTQVPVVVVQSGLGATISETVLVAVSGASPPPEPGVTVSIAPTSVSLAPLATRAFTASVGGSSHTAVSWSVNGIGGGNGSVGTISAAGLYAAPAVPPSPATVAVRATSVANPTAYAQASVTITGGALGTADLAAARLLEQATFGPTAAAIARVKQLGVNGWLDEQFGMPQTPIALSGNDNRTVQSQYLNRLSAAPDQLRQRVACALSQVIVISINKNNTPEQIVPYLQVLDSHAFGNYRSLLGQISSSAQMGKYLDIANSNKPTATGAANENYVRELMQLFSIGLVRLHPDGSPVLDGSGRSAATYTQAELQQMALAFTGWTYAGSGNNNWENFSGPLVAREVNHDTRAKSFLGCTLPAGQTAQQDLEATLDCVFAHPNVPPFMATRLIRSLVKSNPSPAYVQRVAAVFANNGSGVRGDLRATVRALLTDAEARNDTAGADSGRLKDPIEHVLATVRALGGSVSATNQQAWSFSRTGQTPLAPPSVFGFHSPLFRVPRSALYGPEFQIYTPNEAVLRGNYLWDIINNPGTDFPGVDISRFVALGADATALIDACDQAFLYGRMPASMRSALASAVAAQPDNRSRALTAIYLTLLSGQHAVQH
jgi:uncharacterized protein (DUF1800 family)